MNSLQFVGRVFNQFSVVFFRVFRLQSTGHAGSQLQNVRIVCLLWELIFIGHLETKDAVPFTIASTVNKVDIANVDRRWRSGLESGVKLSDISVSRARRSCPSLIERGDIALPSLIINEVKCV